MSSKRRGIKVQILEAIGSPVEGSKANKVFSAFINLLIITSVVFLYLETFDSLVNNREQIFGAFYIVSTLIFTIEYLLRLWTADLLYPKLSKGKARIAYIKSGYAIIDALATFPAYFPFANTRFFFNTQNIQTCKTS